MYTEISDSIGRFFTNLKNTTDSVDYETFVAALPTDSTEAFDVFGSRSTGLKDTMNALTDSLGKYVLLLHNAIDPTDQLTHAQFWAELSSAMTCFYADTTILTVDYLLDQSFGTGASANLRLADDFDCAGDLQTNLAGAQMSYNQSLGSCIGTLGCPGLLRPLCVGACYAYFTNIYNNAKLSYLCIYYRCMNKTCPVANML